MDEVTKLRIENERLVAQCGDLRNKFLQMQQVAHSAQEALNGAVIEKERLSNQLAQWRKEMEGKERELAELRSRLQSSPSDVKQLEEQLREECEMKLRLHKELQDNENFREKFNELRREMMILKNDYEQKLQQQEKTIDEKTIAHEDRVRTLSLVIADLETRLDDRTQANTIKLLQKQKAELEEQLRCLSQELNGNRDGHERSALQLAEAARTSSTRIADLNHQLTTLSNDLQRQKEKNKNMEEELLRLRFDNDRLHTEKLKLETSSELLRTELDQLSQKLKLNRGFVKDSLQERESEWNAEKNALERKLAELTRRTSEMETMQQDLVRQKSQIELAAKAKIDAVQHDEREKAKSLERELASVVAEKESNNKRDQTLISELRDQVSSLKKELGQLRLGRSEDEATLRGLESKLENQQRQLAWLTAERDDAVRALQQANDHNEEMKVELESALELRVENDHLRLQNEFLTRDNRELEAEREQTRSEFASKLQQLQKAYAQEKRSLIQKLDAARAHLAELKDKNERRKVKFASQMLRSEKRAQEVVAELNAREKELKKLHRQVQLLCTNPDPMAPSHEDPDLTDLYRRYNPNTSAGPILADELPLGMSAIGVPSAAAMPPFASADLLGSGSSNGRTFGQESMMRPLNTFGR